MNERIRVILHKDSNGNLFYLIKIKNKRTIHALESYYDANGTQNREIEKLDDTRCYYYCPKQTKINRKFSFKEDILKGDANKIGSASIKAGIKHFDNVFVKSNNEGEDAFILCKLGKTYNRTIFGNRPIYPFRKLISSLDISAICAHLCFEKFKVINSINDYLPLVYYSNSVRYKDVLKKTASRIEKIVEANQKEIAKIVELKSQVDDFFLKRNELLKEYRNLSPNNGTIKYNDCIKFNKHCMDFQNAAARVELELSFYLDTNSNDIEHYYDDLRESRNDCVFYRGVTDAKYNCKPKIFREQTLLSLEDTTYREYRMRFPDMFRNKTTIESITLMQHFGCPTRLLDITTNPLVALFMSCYSGFSKTNDEDAFGEIITFFPHFLENDNEVKYYDSKRVAVLSCLSRLDIAEKRNLVQICSRLQFNKKNTFKEFIDLDPNSFLSKKSSLIGNDRFIEKIEKGKIALKHLLSMVFQEHNVDCSDVLCADLMKSYYVKTPLNNERIRAQSGCFILCGLDDNYIDEHFSSSRNESDFYRIIVKDKRNLLNELQQLNIHQASMMPDLENVADYLTKNKY